MSNKHPNQWFLDICPDQWHDKDFFIENTLFAALIHYWESEDGEKELRSQFEIDYDEDTFASKEDWENRINTRKQAYDALKAAYEFATSYGKMVVDALSDETMDAMTKHMVSIVTYRGLMWT